MCFGRRRCTTVCGGVPAVFRPLKELFLVLYMFYSLIRAFRYIICKFWSSYGIVMIFAVSYRSIILSLRI
ncbi:hypothetical protein RchiOBHm_Chr6g0264901 [Rosa chinensis]|uniref:Uncharacterized protein n=1 Tax=Rosa chinensis TaxID=74649 RepID=A0A2P6PPA1_ROSCH|nr:hypothetical protein RchiOBHm_Chr6g0264901 [Rosa chinensis]